MCVSNVCVTVRVEADKRMNKPILMYNSSSLIYTLPFSHGVRDLDVCSVRNAFMISVSVLLYQQLLPQLESTCINKLGYISSRRQTHD